MSQRACVVVIAHTEKEDKKPAPTKPAAKADAKPVTTILDDPAEAQKAKKRAERFGGRNEAQRVKT
jgi:hypothetical protein